jgi:predicted nucleic acid-binding Zn ribbon protein
VSERRRGGFRAPRSIGDSLREVRAEAAPATPLAAVQSVWAEVAGPAVAAESEPVAERHGLVTISCRSAVWAQELDLLQDELLARLQAALDERERSPVATVTGLRFTADRARHEGA